jgi:hypothetical protein
MDEHDVEFEDMGDAGESGSDDHDPTHLEIRRGRPRNDVDESSSESDEASASSGSDDNVVTFEEAEDDMGMSDGEWSDEIEDPLPFDWRGDPDTLSIGDPDDIVSTFTNHSLSISAL